ncbi:hypothetical protein KYC5002_43130 [Archangium violaceum]|uniref:hypothetical protein n=1 Tax=Archangium violaceum TaxID=83451 RepID=UPI002B31F4FA|nr:hypothetical protein KYC5002_43130 [Archangium gephyra]
MRKLCTALGVLAMQLSGASALAQVTTVYSGDNASGTAVQISGSGTYAMDSGCGPALGLSPSNVLGFRPRFIQLADGYQVRLQGWHANPGDTHCAGPSSSLVPPTCVNSKNIYDAGCVSSWVYANVGGAVIIEKVPTPQTDPGVLATVYSGDNFSGKAVAIRAQGTYAMDSECGPALGLSTGHVLGFRPRSILLADGYQVRLQGWHANPGETHCAGPSSSLVPITCTNSKNIYDAGCVSNWVYYNVGGAVIIEKVPTPQTDPGVLATVYSADNFSGKAVAIRGLGTYAMDSECGPALGLSTSHVLGFRPRSILLASGRQVKLQGWYGNPGETHCAGPSASLVPPTCTNSKNIYDPGCVSNWVYYNVGGAVLVE